MPNFAAPGRSGRPLAILALLSTLPASGALATDAGEALREAARAGDLTAVRAALVAGTPIDAAGRHQVTALLLAAQKGHLPVVHALIAAGADVDRRETFFGQSPLDAALGDGHREVALALLAAGGDDPVAALAHAVETSDLELASRALAAGGVEPLDLSTARRRLAEREQELASDAAATAALGPLSELLAAASVSRPDPATFTPDLERLRAVAGRYRGRELEATAEVRGSRLVLTLSPATAPSADGTPTPTVLELVPVRRDRFESPTGDLRFEVAGRAGLIEWASLNRDGEVVGLGAVTSPDAPELATREAIAATPASRGPARDWPRFRGPDGSGIGDGQGAPARWDLAAGGNVRFKTAIPGIALSSPIVVGGRIYLTTAVSSKGDSTFRTGLYGDGTSVDDLSEHGFALYALDATSGAVLWQREVVRTTPTVRRHLKSSLANPTPVSDGERIVVLFSTVGVLAAFDRDGRELWRRDVGVLDCNDPQAGAAEWGCASSPILFDGLVIVQADHRRDSFLAAYRLANGEEAWRVARNEPSTWATPALLPAPGKTPSVELVTNGTTVRGYDPATGAELWRLGPNSEVVVATPVIGDGVAYVTAGYPPVRPVYAIRAGQRGDLSLPEGQSASDAIVWSHPRGGTYLPTPLLYREHLYTLNNNGLLTVYRAADGIEVHRARVGPAGTSFAASPVAADGRIYLAAESGDVFVLGAAPDFGLLATNGMGEVVMATPAIADGLLVVRTLGHVVGIAETPAADAAGTP